MTRLSDTTSSETPPNLALPTAVAQPLTFAIPEPAVQPTLSFWAQAWRRFVRQRAALFAGTVLLTMMVVAIAAPITAPYDPNQQFRKDGLDANGLPRSPDTRFWLGTDGQGRDQLSRLIYGARVSLGVSLVASSAAVLIGLLVGSIAGFAGGVTDTLVMRLVDMVISLPSFFVILLIVAIFQSSIWVTIVVITMVGWTYPARLFRAEIRSLREREFVLAARCLGVPTPQILRRHLLPHMLPLIVIYIGLGVPGAIFAEAGLSFLGLGIPPPTAAWGSMIQAGTGFYRASPLQVLLPGAAIMITVVCFNLLGGGLRDALDPTLRDK